MIWKEVYGFPNYEINEVGEIRNLKGLVLKIQTDSRGYRSIRLFKGGHKYTKRISKLLWESFNECRCKDTVDHIDQDKLNNNINNLRCISQSENSRNRNNYSRKNNVYNLTDELKKYIITNYRNGKLNTMDIQRQYGIPTNYFSVVVKRKTWDKLIDN